MDFFGDFELQHKSISFARWRHDGTIIMRSVDPDSEFDICILT